MKPRILILADGFGAPAYNPRLRTLCDYLCKQGYTIEVAAEYIQPLPFSHPYPVHEIRIYKGGVADWVFKNLLTFVADWKNRHFSTMVEKKFGQQQFDLIFCTTFHTFPLRAAVDFGRRHHIPVVCDIRDITEQAPGNQTNYLAHRQKYLLPFVKPYLHINKLRRNKQLRRADCVTTISPWHTDFLRQFNPNTHLIYNGYDEDIYTPLDCPSGEFVISYCGKFFGEPVHNPALLFEALAQLTDIPYKLLIHTDPAGQELLKRQTAAYGIEAHTVLNGYIPQDEVLNLYRKSSILLVFTNKASDKNVHGLMTTKFFEALGVEKPVLCVRSDEECLAQVISDTNAGLAATSADEIKTFILDKYHEWQARGFTRQKVRNKQFFARQQQYRQLEKLLLDAVRGNSTDGSEGNTVGIVIPAYNAGPYIKQCLDSLCRQTYRNWHAVAVDDGSTDDTLQIMRTFAASDTRFTVLAHNANRGQSAARNTALRHLLGADGFTCSHICFVDADDTIAPSFLATILRHADGCEVVQTGYIRTYPDGSCGQPCIPRHFYRFTSPCMRLYSSGLLRGMTFPEGMIYEDVVFSLNLWGKHPSHRIIGYAGYYYRCTPDSTTARRDKEAERTLFRAIKGTRAPMWLKAYTCLRLKLHFMKHTG